MATLTHAFIRTAEWKSAHAEGDLSSGTDIAQATGNISFRMGQLSDVNRLLGSTLQGSVDGRPALTPAGGGSRAQIQLDAKDVAAGGITGQCAIGRQRHDGRTGMNLAAQSPAVAASPRM